MKKILKWKKKFTGTLMGLALVSTGLHAQMQDRVENGAALELKGKIWSGAGQAGTTGFDGFENYWNLAPADQKPNIFMDYYDTWNMNERWSIELKRELLKFHRQGYYVLPQFGINVYYLWQEYLAGTQNDELDNLVKGLKYLGMPAFIRIGYEFNNFPGDPWLTAYTPEQFAEVYRIIADKIRESGIEVALVWDCGLSGKQNIMDYYPGDEYVDWMGFNTFSDIAGGQHSTAVAMMNEATERNIPVLIGEASPMIVNQVTYDKWGWYETYFSMIEDQPTLKQMTYINWDWDVQDMVGGNGMFPWGDSRLQMPGSVKDQFFSRIDNDKYFFATSEKETRALFFYNDKQAPAQVTGLRRSGDKLVWNKVTDNGESGLAHYTIYKDGKMWDYIIGEEYPIQDLYYGYDADIQVLAMDRAGNASPLSAALTVNLDNRYELLWDGEFDYPSTSVAVDWKWMGTQDGDAKSGPDDIIIDNSGKLSGQNSCILPDYQMQDNMNNWWRYKPKEYPKDWKVQLFQAFQVQEGEEYTITFQIMAEEERSFKLYFMDHHVDPFHTHFPAGQDPNFDTEWQFYEIWDVTAGPEPKTYTFKAVAPVTETARLSFMMGNTEPTTMWIDAVSVSCGLDMDDPVPVPGDNIVALDQDNNGVETVTLDGSQSYDEDGTIERYTWKENEQVLAEGEIVNVEFNAGIHIVALEVEDNDGNIASRSIEVIVTNGDPIAVAGEDQMLIDKNDDGVATVELNGSSSQDPDGTIDNYSWKANGKEVASAATASVELPVGANNITLTVTDNSGRTASDELKVIVVGDVTSTATITASSSSQTAENATDDDEASGWKSEETQGAEWVMLDLGAQTGIVGVDLLWGKEYATKYEVQVSVNSNFASYEVVGKVEKGNGELDEFVVDPVQQGQYVRIAMSESVDKGNEVEDATGNFKATISPDVPPTITFKPKASNIGSGFCYLELTVNGSYKGSYAVTPNQPYTVNGVNAGDEVSFGFKYTLPDGAQAISDNFIFTVGEVSAGFYYALNEIRVYASNSTLKKEEGKEKKSSGIKTIKKQSPAISLYPNPVTDVLEISGIEEDTQISVMDLTGKALKTQKGSQVDVSALDPGIYFLLVDSVKIRFIKR